MASNLIKTPTSVKTLIHEESSWALMGARIETSSHAPNLANEAYIGNWLMPVSLELHEGMSQYMPGTSNCQSELPNRGLSLPKTSQPPLLCACCTCPSCTTGLQPVTSVKSTAASQRMPCARMPTPVRSIQYVWRTKCEVSMVFTAIKRMRHAG